MTKMVLASSQAVSSIIHKRPRNLGNLKERLKNDLDIEVSTVKRLFRGCRQVKGGHLAWTAKLKNGEATIGSRDTITDCINAESITATINSIYGNDIVDIEIHAIN